MSIAVDRVQNYYQYTDAESKFHQVMIDDNCALLLGWSFRDVFDVENCRNLYLSF